MKPVFSEKVAQELGYQKYWPQWYDWLISLGIVLFACTIFAGFLFIFFI